MPVQLEYMLVQQYAQLGWQASDRFRVSIGSQNAYVSDTHEHRGVHYPQTVCTLHQELGVNNAPTGVFGRHASCGGRMPNAVDGLACGSDNLFVGLGRAYRPKPTHDEVFPRRRLDKFPRCFYGAQHREPVKGRLEEVRVDDRESERVTRREFYSTLCG